MCTCHCFRIVHDFSDDDENGNVIDSTVRNTNTQSLDAWKSSLLADSCCLALPLPLTMICRYVIRNYLIQYNGASAIKSLINLLPLPVDVRNFLAFINIPFDHVVR